MKEVLNYLIDNCIENESSLKAFKGEIFFSMEYCHIIFTLKDNAPLLFETDDSFIGLEDVDVTNIGISSIKNICIQYGSYLYMEDGKDKVSEMIPYTFIANKLMAVIESKFPQSVNDYHIGAYCIDDSCSMCDDVWEYGFTFTISKTYWSNLDYFLYINHAIKKFSDIKLPSYYSIDISISDDYEISILPSNTKCRRLGYLKLMLQMLQEHPKSPVISFFNHFEKYVQSYAHLLLSYKNKKGIVAETKTGNSAKPYVELAESLGLIHKTESYYELGKMGKAYLAIKRAMSISDDNPFHLSDFERAFFLEQILKKDYLYTYIIMELICKEKFSSYKKLKQTFQKHLLCRISDVLNQDEIVNSSKLLKLKVIERRVKAWDKPMTYLEHILMPRINWLYDLGFVEYFNANNFSLTHNGLRCFLNLSVWNDLEMKLVVNPINYLNIYYIRIFDYIDICDAKQYTSTMEGTLIEYLNQCFDLFKTIAPNRATFSLAANYCKYMLLWNNRVVLDHEEIVSLLNRELSIYYIYKYQAQYKDGYIQKRK